MHWSRNFQSFSETDFKAEIARYPFRFHFYGFRKINRLIFNCFSLDADKGNQVTYFEKIMERQLLSKTGTLVVDNVLYHGLVIPEHRRIVQPKKKTYDDVEKFNNHLLNDERVETTLLTVRDGLMLVRIK